MSEVAVPVFQEVVTLPRGDELEDTIAGIDKRWGEGGRGGERGGGGGDGGRRGVKGDEFLKEGGGGRKRSGT